MATVFSDTSTNTGLVQQIRKMMRVDSTQWPTANIVASVNNWLDFITGYAIGSDGRFQWDNTEHTALPEGTANATINVSDYSFLTDEQGNAIVTLLGISYKKEASADYEPLTLVDRKDQNFDIANFGQDTGVPTEYDKIADNIIRLNFKPVATITGGLKFYFQRASPIFVAADTTKKTGFSPLLDRGFVIAGAYDGALTLGLANLNALAAERTREERRVVDYFAQNRDRDDVVIFSPEPVVYE